MKTAILVLAAGTSSRMKQPKLMLRYKKQTLIGWAIKHAKQSKANDVFVVLGNMADNILKEVQKYSVQTILNTSFQDGLSSSIVAGVKKLKAYDAILVTLADQPKVDDIYLDKLLDHFKRFPQQIIASKYESSIGVPALFPKAYFNDLLKLTGDKGAKQFLNQQTLNIKTINAAVNLTDIDTPEDYRELTNNNT